VNQRQADGLLVLIALIWGTTFTVVHETVASFPALALIALRFWFAAAVFGPTLIRRRAELDRRGLMVGALLGGLLFAGFATQTLGLSYTSPARAGFITGLNVVLVPLLGLGFGQRPTRRAVLGVILAVLGLTFLSWGCQIPWLGCTVSAEYTPQQWLGDLLVLACAVAFAMHIVAVSRWATALPVLPINSVQLIVVAILATLAALASEWPLPAAGWSVWSAALFLGVVATALVFALLLKLQRHTTATHTALIFALEPVFAAFFSWLWIGEALTAAVWIGGSLMLLGVIVAEVQIIGRRGIKNGAQAHDDVLLDGAS
jgi:drug/metabolite transporter (DMT)-like permease